MKKASIAAALLFSLVLAAVCFCVGFHLGQRRETGTVFQPDQTFYAEILSIRDNSLHVSGLSVNDINFRSEFTFSVSADTLIQWHCTDLSLDQLEEGDHIAVSFSGEILETFPARVLNVTRLQLLDDAL